MNVKLQNPENLQRLRYRTRKERNAKQQDRYEQSILQEQNFKGKNRLIDKNYGWRWSRTSSLLIPS